MVTQTVNGNDASKRPNKRSVQTLLLKVSAHEPFTADTLNKF